MEKVVFHGSVTVKDFAAKLGKTPAEVVMKLMQEGVTVTINEILDPDIAAIIGEQFGFTVTFENKCEPGSTELSCKARLKQLLAHDDPARAELRPPIVVVMGHVDHGKTKLLDAIRKTNVVDSEAGGITQHIGAYQVIHQKRKITFLDTPGHEAFAAMRARGAEVTDIAILVVAANEGVKPQTREAISHARAAQMPIIVAINKIDLPDANPDKVLQELSEAGVQTEKWGGDTVAVQVSAKEGKNISELLDMILLSADMLSLKADPTRPAVGTIIEANKGSRGAVTTALIMTGTLRTGDAITAGVACGTVRVLENHNGELVSEAGPAAPALITGFEETPHVGDILEVQPDRKAARAISANRLVAERMKQIKGQGEFGLADMAKAIHFGQLKKVPVILKTDVEGSAEAIVGALQKIKTEEAIIHILHQGVGDISETDLDLAKASQAIIIGFNVKASTVVKELAKRQAVQIKFYSIIYQLLDELKQALSGLLAPEIIEEVVGRLRVLAVFKLTKKDVIFGGKVLDGKVIKGKNIFAKVVREDKETGRGNVVEVQCEKEQCDSVNKGKEAGIRAEGLADVVVGDTVEIIRIREEAKKL